MTARERALVEYLLDGPYGSKELREQARTAQVEAVCSCGCPSVWLQVDKSAPTARFAPEQAPFGRIDHVPITAIQRKARGSTEVTLHVCGGYLEELEIWAGGYGVRPRIDLAKLEYFEWRDVEAETE